MALDANIRGSVTGNGAEVTSTNFLKVIGETNAFANPGNIGGFRTFSEIDQGVITGVPAIVSSEVDVDYRLRVSQDLILDDEVFNYTSQNTGKHSYSTTTLVNAWTAGNMTTNSANTAVLASGTGSLFSTYAYFPVQGTQTISCDVECGFSAQSATNVFIEWGMMLPGTQASAPTDGVFFRLSSAGLQGIASSNTTEISTGIFPASAGVGTWTYTNNKKYQFICYVSAILADFWVNDGVSTYRLGSINLPSGLGRVIQSSSLQFAIKHRVAGGSSSVAIQGLFNSYNIRLGGTNINSSLATSGSRIYGSYQGMSGGTMGSIARFGTITTGNETNPAPALATTTTAALGTGLGGSFWETATLAVATDGIIMSYQVPTGSISSAGRRLVLRGLNLASYVQAALVGAPSLCEWFIAFGHNAVSLATAEASTTKAPRRIALPFIQTLTATQAAGTTVSQNIYSIDFGDSPIYINPGEFLQVCVRRQGTAITGGTLVHKITPIFSWE